MIRYVMLLSILCILFGIACAAPTNAPVPAASTIPAAPPTTAPPTVVPTAPPVPTAAPTVAAKPAAAPTTAASNRASTAGGVVLTVVPQSSEARFVATEQLVGRNLPNNPVGRTSGITGTVALDASGAVVSSQSKIVVDLRTLKSDQQNRDNFIQRSTLQTSQYPLAEFVPLQVQGLPGPIPTTGEASFQLAGILKVHGVERPATWQVTAQFGEQQVKGTANTTLKISDFGMIPPKAGPVLSIEDALKLEIDFVMDRQPTSAGV